VREFPHAIEAEMKILGAILLCPATYGDTLEYVSVEDFSLERHRVIYKAIGTLALRGTPSDIVILSSYLDEIGGMEKAGGRLYLNELLVQGASGGVALPYYCRLVRSKAVRRRVILAGNEVAELGYDEAMEPEAVYTKAMEIVTAAGKGLAVGEIKHVSDLGDGFMDWIKLQRTGNTGGLGTGFSELDKIVGDLTGCLVVVAGATSMGKSVCMLNMAWRLANAGTPVGFLTLEMTPEQLMKRLVQCAGHIQLRQLRFTSDAELRSIVKKVCTRLLFLCTFTENTLWSVLGQMSELVRRQQCKVIFVDHLQELTIPGYRGERYQELGAIMRAMRAFALKNRVEVCIGSQISRDASKDKGRPKLHQLRESGDIENSMDVGIGLYREAYYEPTKRADVEELEAIVLKQRNGDIGIVHMTLFRQEQRIEEGFEGKGGISSWVPGGRPSKHPEGVSTDVSGER
jgi:replicative DNA helicase